MSSGVLSGIAARTPIIITFVIFVAVIVFVLFFNYWKDSRIVTCPSCGWKGSYEMWRLRGSCPTCGNERFTKRK